MNTGGPISKGLPPVLPSNAKGSETPRAERHDSQSDGYSVTDEMPSSETSGSRSPSPNLQLERPEAAKPPARTIKRQLAESRMDATHQDTVSFDQVVKQFEKKSYPWSRIFPFTGRRTFTQSEIEAAANSVISTDSRFKNVHREPMDSEYHLLSGIEGNRHPATVRSSTIDPGRYKSFYKDLTHALVGCIRRADNSVKLALRDYRQNHGHLVMEQEDGQWHAQYAGSNTQSSDNLKRKTANRNVVANQAMVSHNGHLIVGRSANTQHTGQLLELLSFNAMQALSAQDAKRSAPGLDTRSKPPKYSMTIVSAMDLNKTKSRFTRVFGEDERAYLAQMQRNAQQLFAEHPNGITLTIADADGNTSQVTLMPPQILNLTLSKQSAKADNIKAHRDFNRDAATLLGYQFLCNQGWIKSDAAEQQRFRSLSPQERLSVIKQHIKILRAAGTYQSSPQNRLAFEALHLAVFGETVPRHGAEHGETLLEANDAAYEFMLMSHLVEAAGNGLSVQCKSGQDRTISMVAWRTLMHEYAQQHKKPLDPLALRSDPESERTGLKAIFTKTVNAFGEPMAAAVRGYHNGQTKLKIRSHPAAMSWYDADTVGGMSPFRGLGRVRPNAGDPALERAPLVEATLKFFDRYYSRKQLVAIGDLTGDAQRAKLLEFMRLARKDRGPDLPGFYGDLPATHQRLFDEVQTALERETIDTERQTELIGMLNDVANTLYKNPLEGKI